MGRPLSVAWVWPLQAEPAYLANGFINLTTADDFKGEWKAAAKARQELRLHNRLPDKTRREAIERHYAGSFTTPATHEFR